GPGLQWAHHDVVPRGGTGDPPVGAGSGRGGGGSVTGSVVARGPRGVVGACRDGDRGRPHDRGGGPGEYQPDPHDERGTAVHRVLPADRMKPAGPGMSAGGRPRAIHDRGSRWRSTSNGKRSGSTNRCGAPRSGRRSSSPGWAASVGG